MRSDRSRVTYSKEHREQSVAEGLPLITIDYDGRHLDLGTGAAWRFTYQGVTSEPKLAEVIKTLRSLVVKAHQHQRQKQAAAKKKKR